MSIYVNRGSRSPHFANVSASIANYLSTTKRQKLLSAVNSHESEAASSEANWEELRSVLKSQQLTAWGATEHYEETFENLESGDTFLIRTDYPTADERRFRYAQPIDFVAGESFPEPLCEKLAEIIWDNEEYKYLWFSTTTVSNIDVSEAKFDSIIEPIEGEFSIKDWFNRDDNFKQVNPEWIDHYGGDDRFLSQLIGGNFTEVRLIPERYLVLDIGDESELQWYESPDSEVSKNYLIEESKGRGTPLKSLREYRNSAVVFFRENNIITGQGRLGYVGADDRDHISGTSATIIDYEHLFEENIDSLEAALTPVDGSNGLIGTIDRETARTIIDTEAMFPSGQLPTFSPDRLQKPRSKPHSSTADLAATSLTWGEWTDESVRYPLTETDSHLSFDGLYYDSTTVADIRSQITRALQTGKHLILVGPPGTGKTELAQRICELYVDDRYELTTATDDWSTFDTIGGYRPSADSDELTFHPGLFLKRFIDTQQSPSEPKNEWLIIDELNRAPIDEAFGSLFTALAGGQVTLPFETSDQDEITLYTDAEVAAPKEVQLSQLYLPDEWRLIATMNTDDKSSLYQMSYAFMRRFAFIEVPPPQVDITPELVLKYIDVWGVTDGDDLPFKHPVVIAIAGIWAEIQSERSVGPALIKDLITDLLQQYEMDGQVDVTSPIKMYLIPQFEGLTKRQLLGIYGNLDDYITDVDAYIDSTVTIDSDELKRVTEELSGINLDR